MTTDERKGAKVAEMDENELSRRVIGAAIEVHREIGPGLLESVYESALTYELEQGGLVVQRQVPIAVRYKGVMLSDCGYRADLIVEDTLIVELKALELVLPVHEVQLLTYLRLTDKRLGLLINFSGETLKAGVRRVVNGL